VQGLFLRVGISVGKILLGPILFRLSTFPEMRSIKFRTTFLMTMVDLFHHNYECVVNMNGY
jgi:hypothetical protein